MPGDDRSGGPAAAGGGDGPGGAGPAAFECVDSHAHLAMPQFSGDLAEVLERARRAGITDVLTAATDLRDAARNVEIASAPGPVRLWAAVGVHPHEARRWRAGDEERLAALASDPKVVAIGECGLDYHYDLSPREEQREVLARQVRLAGRLSHPLVVHCREAAREVGAILESEDARAAGGVLHCFTEDRAFAFRCLDLGFYVSFSGILTFRGSEALREVARAIPEDRLLVETDAPYLAPAPRRGGRNEPARAADVLEALALIRGADPRSLSRVVAANFHRFIGGRPRISTTG